MLGVDREGVRDKAGDVGVFIPLGRGSPSRIANPGQTTWGRYVWGGCFLICSVFWVCTHGLEPSLCSGLEPQLANAHAGLNRLCPVVLFEYEEVNCLHVFLYPQPYVFLLYGGGLSPMSPHPIEYRLSNHLTFIW